MSQPNTVIGTHDKYITEYRHSKTFVLTKKLKKNCFMTEIFYLVRNVIVLVKFS